MRKILGLRHNESSIFEKPSKSTFYPRSFHLGKWALVLRNGLVLKNITTIKFTSYGYVYFNFKYMFICLLSLVKRRVSVDNSQLKKYVIIHSPWSTGYYHWLTESLPRLIAVTESPDQVTVLLPDKSYSKYEESIRMIGFQKIDYFPSGSHLLLKNLIVTECPRHWATLSPPLLMKIKSRLENYDNSSTTCGNRLLYISRSKSRGRKVINEGEIIHLILGMGGCVINCEELSFNDQVAMFRKAFVIVGNHGAGLSNMLFMPSGGAVVELLPFRNGFFDFRPIGCSFKHQVIYKKLAGDLGHSYDYLQCRSDVPWYRATDMANIIVDISQLKTKIELHMRVQH